MTTLGAQAAKDVTSAAMNVVAAFKGDDVLDRLHPVQRQALQDLEAACRFLYELVQKERR